MILFCNIRMQWATFYSQQKTKTRNRLSYSVTTSSNYWGRIKSNDFDASKSSKV